ncbi:hypothetical protein NFI96_003095 [Prochilodus magdalenae]|nr:hypothetical protein NFI96_003095 [Prochilodus magdalenae]
MDTSLGGVGWTPLWAALDGHLSGRRWMDTSLGGVGWTPLWAALDGNPSGRRWMDTSLGGVGWKPLWAVLDGNPSGRCWMDTSLGGVEWTPLWAVLDGHLSGWCGMDTSLGGVGWKPLLQTMERLLLNHLRPQVHHAEDPLQFAYREKVGVEDAILYLLHRTHSHLDKGGCAVRVMFFDFSSAFNTIQQLLRDKLMKMVGWTCTWSPGFTDYREPSHRETTACQDQEKKKTGTAPLITVISSTGAPQGLFSLQSCSPLYTSDFKYNSEFVCHMQKFSDDTAIVGCVRNVVRRGEYRSLV